MVIGGAPVKTASEPSIAAVHLGLSLLTLFPGRVGGSETNVRGLLAEFVAGHGPERVTVLANRHVAEAYASRVGGPVSLRHVRSYRPGDRDITRFAAMQAARLAPRLAARDVPAGLDVVHYPVTVPIPRVAAPTVVTLFDVQHHDMPELFTPLERRLRAWAYDGAARSATRVVTSSAYSRDRLVEHVGVDRDRIDIIALGIDHARFRPEGPGDEAALAGLAVPDRFVVYPANLWPHKNHARLVEALARTADPDVCLVLTGQTYDRLGTLMDTARRYGVSGRVRHLGFVARDQLAALYRRAAGMVFPSLFEGFGAPPLEAMACGCPVASSLRASLQEVVAGASLALDPEDPDDIAAAIDRLAGDEDLRRRLVRSGRERAGAYTWAAAARAHVATYARALGA
jgi:glycosyltransferase involved in cell wall biosynthesis